MVSWIRRGRSPSAIAVGEKAAGRSARIGLRILFVNAWSIVLAVAMRCAWMRSCCVWAIDCSSVASGEYGRLARLRLIDQRCRLVLQHLISLLTC
jgi:hypothetical protein